MVKKIFPLFLILILCSGLFLIGKGLYIPVKAFIAQILLEDSWNRIGTGEKNAKPWPWADFRPVACLYFPDHHYRTIVVNSASGTSLAFAPGHLDGTVKPGSQGNCVIYGHRETHFNILQQISPGDRILLTAADGNVIEYRVSGIHIVSQSDIRIMNRSEEKQLTLITCYPFQSILPGNERFVVTATSREL